MKLDYRRHGDDYGREWSLWLALPADDPTPSEERYLGEVWRCRGTGYVVGLPDGSDDKATVEGGRYGSLAEAVEGLIAFATYWEAGGEAGSLHCRCDDCQRSYGPRGGRHV